jgi:hypothetical protein
MLVVWPITVLVFAGCVGLGIIAHEHRNRVLTVAVYALLAGYWALLADILRDLDL